MKRKFTVNAKSKIQASPVDFGSLRDMKKSIPDPESIKNEIESNREELEAYFDAKIIPVVDQLNEDSKTICNDFVYEKGASESENKHNLENYLNVLGSLEQFNTMEESSVLAGFKYETILEEDYAMVLWDVSDCCYDDDIKTSEIAFPLFYDSDIDYLYKHGILIGWPEASYFIDALSVRLTKDKSILEQLSVDNVVDTCQQLIYEYAEYIDFQYSAILEEAAKKYMEEYQ